MKQRVARDRLVMSLGIGIGIVLLVMGFATATTGRDEQGLPLGLQRIEPAPGDSQTLRQSEVKVTLDPGQCARLTINRIVLPTYALEGNSLQSPVSLTQGSGGVGECGDRGAENDGSSAMFDPALSTISFRPTEGAPIDKFGKGPQFVLVEYWRIDAPQNVMQFNWSFNVDL